MKKRLIIIALALAMLCAAVPAGINAFAAGDVTRAEWVSQLVAAFDMTVENDDNMPDNYFSDISEDMPYYRDILLAVEFGVINIEAGEPFCPDEPATREFAAQTLNSCLLFQLGEDESYTFSESGSVTYPDDIQVAINRGWFKLSGNNFMPEQAVTTAEMTAMLDDAKAVLASEVIDENHQNTFEFAPGVIEIPATANTSIAADNTVTITDYDPKIKAGDIFVVYTGDLPVALKATNVTADGSMTIISAAKEGAEGAIVSADAEGVIDVDLENIEAPEPVTYQVYDEAEAYAAAEDLTVEAADFNYDKKSKTLSASYSIKLGGSAAGTVSAKLSNLQLHHKQDAAAGNYMAYITADTTVSTSVSFDFGDYAGIPSTVKLCTVRVAGIGTIALDAEISLKGGVSMTWVGKLKTGFSKTRHDGFKFEKQYTKKEFSFTANIDIRMGLKLSAGIDLLLIKGNIYGTVGANVSYIYKDYSSGTPKLCETTSGYMYAKIGVNVSVIGVDVYNKSIDIYTADNSPIRVVIHYEDSVYVGEKCSRGQNLKYLTKPTSKYFNPSPSYGQGSYGGSSGGSGSGGASEPVVIWEYTLDSDNNATITKYRGNASAVAIPSKIDGHTVTTIGAGAFRNNKSLYAVTMPDTVTSISNNVFYGCTNLSNIKLSKNLTSIGWRSFEDCVSLTDIEIPKSLKEIVHSSYNNYKGIFNNSGLKTVTFEEGTSQVIGYLFYGANNLENVTLLDTMTQLEYDSFAYCTSLQSISIPETVTYIGTSTFIGCTSLDNIIMPDAITSIGSNVFYGCTNLSNIKLSKNLTSIGWRSFEDCVSLTDIEIPKSLKEIVHSSYNNYKGIFNNSGLKTVTFEEGTSQIIGYLFYGANNLENVTLLDTMTQIEYNSFAYCTSLQSISIPETVTYIGASAFLGCTSLKETYIPDSVISMGSSLFEGCTNLKKVRLPNGRENIMARMFFNCKSLTDIELPKTVTTIQSDAFYGCSLLENIILPEILTTIESSAFYECSALKEITVPQKVTSIGSSAFYNCDALTSAVINGSGNIGDRAFYDCDALTSIELADGVTSIGSNMCYGCDKLTNVKLGKYIEKIPDSAFRLCQSLTTINIPRFCTTIAANAFAEDTKLSSAYIPPYVTKIENNSFSYPTKMTAYGKSGSYAEEYAKSRNMKFNPVDAPITSISFAENEVFADRGKNIVLPMNITLEFDTDTITFSSSDENVATVKENGVINTKNYGTTTITASTSGGRTATCTLRVLSDGTIIKFEAEKNGDTANVHIETGIVPAGAAVYIAAYDKDGVLTSFTAADLADYTADTTIPINGTRKLKAFVWDSKTLEPLTQAKEINI